jgi:light-regulated signal transduction histidine kinase (bacteriophytochrome)/ActR/RegA family two-component response regulator
MSHEPVDLTNCDREPIHIPGAIQPHGVLLACRGVELTIVQVSDNVVSMLGRTADQLLQSPLSELLSPASMRRLDAAVRAGLPREVNPMALETADGSRFDGIVHASATAGVTIVELEPRSELMAGFHPQMRQSVRHLQRASTLDDLFSIAAREVRALTGFDRVMVYRFDRDWNGEVVAEDRLDTLEPFLGLHYPAADIPVQARRLYTLNWLRIIPDITYQAARLVPDLEPESRAPLDLSFSVLRSVSPIHIEYLRNMGVTASMSVSLVRDGTLIGLIACHHYSGPHFVPFAVRDTAEFLGQTLSWQTASFEDRAAAERAVQAQRAESRLLESINDSGSVSVGLCTPALLELTAAQGAVVLYEGRIQRIGATPADRDVRNIVDTLSRDGDGWLHVTDRLCDHLPYAGQWGDVAAGVLAVEISRELGEYVIWFRPATDRTVNWAGDPRKIEVVDAGGTPRLSPRGSFALWRETVQGRSLPWEPWQVEAAGNLRRLLLGSVRRRAHELRLMNDRLSEADRMKDEFLATVGHELRTPLNAMLGWIHILQVEDGSPSVETDSRRRRALDTVERNARAQAQLIDDLLDVSRIVAGKLTLNVQPVEVGELIERAIEAIRPAAEAKAIRLQPALDATAIIRGDPHRLQQVAANLLSNAIKFTPRGGRVQVFVERSESSVEVTVADSGQGIAPEFLPHVFDRFRQADGATNRKSSGLGLGLAIVRHIVELHGGTISVQSDGPGRGATFVARLPVSVAAKPAPEGKAFNQPELKCPAELAGWRALVVDDEPDAREMLTGLLEHCRMEVTTAPSGFAALELLRTWQPDVIISDIGMPEMDGFSFIEQLRQRPAEMGGRVPAVALTAHVRVSDRTRALYSGFNNHLPKPVEPMELYAVIAALRRSAG